MSLPELLRPRVAVELSLRPASLQAVTRAADEGRITDTNLYLFGRNATFAQHLYATTGRLRFECPPATTACTSSPTDMLIWGREPRRSLRR